MASTSRKPDRLSTLFITRKFPPAVGGMEVYSVELTKELGSRVDLTTRFLPGRSDGRPPGWMALTVFFFRQAFFLIWHRNRFDVIHYGDLVMFPLAWLCHRMGRTCRQVISVHGTDIAFGIRAGIWPTLYRRFLAWAAGNKAAVDVLIANSRATAKHCRKAGFTEVQVIPLGVRLSTDQPAPSPPEDYLLFVGRVARRKGVGWFIREVLPLVPEKMRLKIAGTIWDTDEGMTMENPRVDFLGPVFGEELSSLRRKALAVIMPNIPLGGRDFEGFGLTALEAGADNAVLLASALDGIVDAVSDGTTGILVKPGDPQGWVDAINRVADWHPADREAFLRRARQFLAENYSWERVAAETLTHYQAATDA